MGLKYPEIFQSVTAFAPVVNPSHTTNGQIALKKFLGDNAELWKKNDPTELVKMGYKHPKKILIDQGDRDEFLGKGIKPEIFKDACDQFHQPIELRYQEGYDHSYYFVSTFLKDHINFHLT